MQMEEREEEGEGGWEDGRGVREGGGGHAGELGIL